MLITFVVILLVIWASVVWSIYSEFLTFYRNFEQTNNYNKAYYASLWALERAELAIRQRWPWYSGMWWWVNWRDTHWEWLEEEEIEEEVEEIEEELEEEQPIEEDPIQPIEQELPQQLRYAQWNNIVEPLDEEVQAEEIVEEEQSITEELEEIIENEEIPVEEEVEQEEACEVPRNYSDDKPTTSFSYLTASPTTLYRSISSTTNTIPRRWKWDIDQTISTASDAKNYNKMDYENAEIFLLYYDEESWNPYDSNSKCIYHPKFTKIEWRVRMPNWATSLDSTKPISPWISKIKDDPIIDWQFRWDYVQDRWWRDYTPFTIYSYSDTDVTKWSILSKDSVIRESDINNWSWSNNISFKNSKSPVTKNISAPLTSPEWTIISAKDDELSWRRTKFSDLENVSISWLQLRMSLLNLLKWNDGIVYPYLEYQLKFWNQISDKYYTIDAEWKVWDYKVNLIVQKPTIRESVYWNFTVIF